MAAKAPEPEAPKKETPPPKPEPAAQNSNAALLNALKSYAEAMRKGRPVAPKESVSNQLRLRGAVINALTVPDEKAAIANIRTILEFFHTDESGAFKISHLMRDYDMIPWTSVKDRQETERLLMLFEDLANPETRATKAKRMDLSGLQTVLNPSRSEMVIRRLTLALNLN
jgi:hypothetical protein